MDWLVTIVKVILGNLTPELRKAICEGLKQWEAKAQETQSPWDDIFVAFVKGVMQCP